MCNFAIDVLAIITIIIIRKKGLVDLGVAYIIILSQLTSMLKIFVSSAKILQLLDISVGESLINIVNNIGPNILPCGIPLSTFASLEVLVTYSNFLCPV